MTLLKLSSTLAILSLAICAQAKVTQKDVSGYANIWVLNSSDWKTGSPDQKVGCLSNSGRFVNSDDEECGVFTKLVDYPYTISSKTGNCTFTDENTEKNTDSYYGKNDHAWACNASYVANVYDGLYTIDGFPYPFLCFGDIACFYDAKTVPYKNEKTPLWQFRWGSQQRGITPGHVQLQLMWKKIGDLPKREGESHVPGPRMELRDGMQVPLRGQQIKA